MKFSTFKCVLNYFKLNYYLLDMFKLNTSDQLLIYFIFVLFFIDKNTHYQLQLV